MPSAPATPVPMLDFTRAYAAERDEILAALTAVCDGQRFILGPAVEAFETAAAAACAVPHAAGCASGTDALWLALAALGIGAGDKVLTTPFSFFATASAILRAGATPVFADIDPVSFNLCPMAAARAVERDPAIRALLPVHLYGMPAEMDAFTSLAAAHHLKLVEDAAQAFGATYKGRPVGALGDAAAFSFYPTKNLAAAGDAGLVTTADAAVDARIRSLRAHGMTVRYFHDEVGWNARIDAFQAAILSVRLRRLAAGNQRRRALATRYDSLLAPLTAAATGSGIVLPKSSAHSTHVFHQYVIRAPDRDALRAHLTAGHIGTEIYYPLCLHQQKALASLGYRSGDFPHAERAAAEVLALPMYPELREDEQNTVAAAISDFYRQHDT